MKKIFFNPSQTVGLGTDDGSENILTFSFAGQNITRNVPVKQIHIENHPLKTNLTTTTYSKNDFMVYSGSIGSTNLNTDEYFNTETFRIVSGNYDNQASATSNSNAWSSANSVNDQENYVAYCDGMVTVNGYAISTLLIVTGKQF